MNTMNDEWLDTLDEILSNGRLVSPRGMKVLEVDHHTIRVAMSRSVLTVPERKVSYRAMAGEAAWVLSGSDLLADIEPYISRMREFSDDGVTLWGAYGPRIDDQIMYVIDKLVKDPDTRQATLTTWRPDPPDSRDIPCTVAMDFKIRDGRLDMHVFMRSSDAWLGLPYDVFTFSCVAYRIAAAVNATRTADPDVTKRERVGIGTLFLTAASSHLYERDWEAAKKVSEVWKTTPISGPPSPPREFVDDPLGYLRALLGTKPGDPLRWWEAKP